MFDSKRIAVIVMGNITLAGYCRKAVTEHYFCGYETHLYHNGNYGIVPLVNILQ